MAGKRSRLHVPSADSEPREALEWVRRVEILAGIGSVGFGVALWAEGWWHWLLIGEGLLSLSLWPGVRAILRKAERKPHLLVSDVERRRLYRRRILFWLLPGEFIFICGGGYLIGGWGVAITSAVLGGLGLGLGAWLIVRADRPTGG